MKPKLALIDHSFHRKTRATQFLQDILRTAYEIDIYYDSSWNSGKRIDLKHVAREDYDQVVFFQIIHYPKNELAHLRDRNVTIFPMYDATPWYFKPFWYRFAVLKNLKFISFSRFLHDRLEEMGFHSHCLQYFLPPQLETRADSNGMHGFFWQRTNQITWKHVKKLIKHSRFDSFTVHSASDPPGYTFRRPSNEDTARHHIRVTGWFRDQQDYFNVLRSANLFFAPRCAEGIGMSVLEAISRGMCVVAPNRPTMNEYIRSGTTGLLYSPQHIKSLHFDNLKSIMANTVELAQNGYERWLTSRQDLLEILAEKRPSTYKPATITSRLETKARYVLFRVKEYLKKKFPVLINLVTYFRKFYR